MYERRFEIGQGQHLTLAETSANVTLVTWDEDKVLVRLYKGREEHLTVDDTENGPSLSALTSCEVKVPHAVEVHVRQARGNLTVKGVVNLNAEQIRGNLKLCEIGDAVIVEVYGNLRVATADSVRISGTAFGNADLNQVASVDLQNVRGNLRVQAAERLRASRIGGSLQARGISGAVDCDQVGGNAMLTDVAGRVTLDQVAGSLAGRSLTGGVKAPKVGGNLALEGEMGGGCSYHSKVGGNAVLRLQQEANAYFSLSAGGHLKSSLLLQDEERTGRSLTGTLGSGGAEVFVEAGGNLLLGGDRVAVGTELGEEISRQIEDTLRAVDLEAIGRQVSDEMETALSRLRVKMESIDWDRIGLRTQQAVEKAMDRMQVDMERLTEKTARQQERLERHAEKEAHRRARQEQRRRRSAEREPFVEGRVEVSDAPEEPAGQAEATGLDLEQERLSILRMVEQGQITPQEAEMLLDALE